MRPNALTLTRMPCILWGMTTENSQKYNLDGKRFDNEDAITAARYGRSKPPSGTRFTQVLRDLTEHDEWPEFLSGCLSGGPTSRIVHLPPMIDESERGELIPEGGGPEKRDHDPSQRIEPYRLEVGPDIASALSRAVAIERGRQGNPAAHPLYSLKDIARMAAQASLERQWPAGYEA